MRTVLITSQDSEIHVAFSDHGIDSVTTKLSAVPHLFQHLHDLKQQTEFECHWGDEESLIRYFAWADQVHQERIAAEMAQIKAKKSTELSLPNTEKSPEAALTNANL